MATWRGRQKSFWKSRKIVGGLLAYVMLAVLAFTRAALAASPDELRFYNFGPLGGVSESSGEAFVE